MSLGPTSQKKIAFVSEIPTPYRLPVYELIRKETGVTCDFYFCATSQSDRHWNLNETDRDSYQVLRGWRFEKKGKNLQAIFVNPTIIAKLWQGKYDLAIIGGWAQPTMLLAIATCVLRRIPYVIHSESHSLKPRGILKKFMRKLIPGIPIRLAKAFFVTGTQAKNYIESFSGKRTRVFYFPNTIDVEYYCKESTRLQNKKAVLRNELSLPGHHNLIFVGRLVHVKGVLDLIKAFAIAAENLPDWGLLIIGQGPLKPKIVNEMQHKSWKDLVTIVPYIDPKELIRYYVGSSVFVLPSHDEPWGVVVNEAMACGLPLILADRVGSAADLLVDGENGRRFTAGNIDQLAVCIKEVCSDESLRNNMANKSSEIISSWGYEMNLKSFRAACDYLLGTSLNK